MKKKRLMDRKPIKRTQTPEAATSQSTMASFNNLYQRYIDAVYSRVLLPMSPDVSEPVMEEVMSIFKELTARTNS